MNIEREEIQIAELEQNTGQIEGLPHNPRQWTHEDVERLARSLRETPELFAARPLLVVPHEGKYVILGGNLRFAACVENGDKKAPCLILYGLSTDKMAQIVLKDNGVFGEWNYTMLAQEWNDIDLEELGIIIPQLEDFGKKNKELDVSEYNENITLRLRYPKITAHIVKNRLGENKKETLLKALNYDTAEN